MPASRIFVSAECSTCICNTCWYHNTETIWTDMIILFICFRTAVKLVLEKHAEERCLRNRSLCIGTKTTTEYLSKIQAMIPISVVPFFMNSGIVTYQLPVFVSTEMQILILSLFSTIVVLMPPFITPNTRVPLIVVQWFSMTDPHWKCAAFQRSRRSISEAVVQYCKENSSTRTLTPSWTFVPLFLSGTPPQAEMQTLHYVQFTLTVRCFLKLC